MIEVHNLFAFKACCDHVNCYVVLSNKILIRMTCWVIVGGQLLPDQLAAVMSTNFPKEFCLGLIWRAGIALGVTQGQPAFKLITQLTKSRTNKSIPGLYSFMHLLIN